jgi:uncharacterized protein (DUF1330 family)
MPKGYWIAHAEITDPEGYTKYIEANAKPFAKYGARFLVRSGAYECPEGSTRPRQVIIEFPSYQAALECYQSPEYQKAKALRLAASEADVVIVEGYER